MKKILTFTALLAAALFADDADILDYVDAQVGAAREDLEGQIAATNALQDAALATINSKIPSAASASNQLADKEWIDDEIDTYAAYYITYTAAGEAFPIYAALTNATVYYSGGEPRAPTRNDYAVVLADETHGTNEWRYIYTVAAGATTGQWEAQYPIETNDYDALANKPQINGNTLTGNKTGADLGLLDLAGGTMAGDIELGEGGYILSWDVGGCIKSPTGKYILFPSYDGSLALTSDISAAVTAATKYTDSVVTNCLPLSGGTMTGDINFVVENIYDRDAIIKTTINGRTRGALMTKGGGVSSFGEIVSCAQGYNEHYAPKVSPAFTGTPTAPTPTAGDNSTRVATTAFVHGEIATLRDEIAALTNGVPAVAALTASNTVDALLTPSPLTVEYGNDVTNSFVLAKDWVTQTVVFDRVDGESGPVMNTRCSLYSAGRLRNYSIMIDEIPEDTLGKCVNMSFVDLTNAVPRVYASPAFYDFNIDGMIDGTPCYGWLITTNDIPCVISFRQPEESICIVTREKLEN